MKSITNLVGPRLLFTGFAGVATATPWSILSSSQLSFKHQLYRGIGQQTMVGFLILGLAQRAFSKTFLPHEGPGDGI